MARARFVRPEFFTDTKLSDMPMGASMLFAGVWCHSDLNGVFEYDARLLRGLIFPMREDVSTEDVAAWLALLSSAGMVRAGCQQCADCAKPSPKVWGYVVNWSRHQSISGSEAKWGSKRPKPSDINTASSVPDLSTAPCHAQAASPSPSLTPSPTTASAAVSVADPLAFMDGMQEAPAGEPEHVTKACDRRTFGHWRAMVAHRIFWTREEDELWKSIFAAEGWDEMTKGYHFLAKKHPAPKKIFVSMIQELRE